MSHPPETHPSLIVRIRDPSDREAWFEFVEVYRPVIIRLARAQRLQDADADDLAQQVLVSVAGAIERFDADDLVMRRLLEGGTRGEGRLRRMAQHLALQTMLTEQAPASYRRLRAAACSIRPVPRRVGESGSRRKV